jgi:hypothetical protein
LALSLIVSGCSSNGGGLAQVQSAVQNVFKDCKFEDITVVTGKTYLDSSDESNQVYVTYKINEPSFAGEGASAGVTFAGAGDGETYSVCNTNGLAVNYLGVHNFVNGKTLQEDLGKSACWIPGRAQTKTESDFFSKCKARVDAKSSLGFWIVIHSFTSHDEAVKYLTPKLQESWDSGWGSYPMAVIGNLVIAPAGPFDDVNQVAIDNLDFGWTQIVANLNATLASDLVPGYPDSFDRKKWTNWVNKTSEGSRIDLDNAMDALKAF